jgi:hypothetical protein
VLSQDLQRRAFDAATIAARFRIGSLADRNSITHRLQRRPKARLSGSSRIAKG